MITATAEPITSPILTSPDSPQDGATGGLSPSAVTSQLERILASSTFIRSKRLGRFLRFTVEQCLEGRQNALKEYLVGVEVFNKLETFDPRIDSIVRVEARRLRSKLERYYQTEGREDNVIIQFRKGSYVPVLATREQLRSMGFGEDYGIRSALKSIAISRFNSLGVDPQYAHFWSGLADDLISALTKIQSLRVIAPHAATEDMHPDYVFEGSVRKQGDRVRISAQLIDASSSLYIWSETYERDLNDAFAVQDEISRAIVMALRREVQNGRG